jgi:hypothetical protein
MVVATVSYSPIIPEWKLSVVESVNRIGRYRIRQEFYPIVGVILGFVSMVLSYTIALGSI